MQFQQFIKYKFIYWASPTFSSQANLSGKFIDFISLFFVPNIIKTGLIGRNIISMENLIRDRIQKKKWKIKSCVE